MYILSLLSILSSKFMDPPFENQRDRTRKMKRVHQSRPETPTPAPRTETTAAIRKFPNPKSPQAIRPRNLQITQKAGTFPTHPILSQRPRTNPSHASHAHIPKSKRYLDAKSSTYCFHIKSKIWADSQICISVPLT